MTDITTPLTELRAAYRAYQNAKRDKKEEIMEKYRSRMEDEIRAAVQAEKYAFASLLKDRKDFYDLRVTDIQDHVLRTRNWKVWEDIRDFADIAPEQIVRANAREEKARAASPFQFSSDYLTLTVTKDSTGAELAEPVVYDLTTVSWGDNKWWAASADNNLGLSDAERAAMRGDKKYKQYVSDEIQRQIDAENIDNPLEKE